MCGWALVLGALPACGKKGPPLPPIVHVPDAVRQVSARRVGGEIVLTITVPTQNVDGSTPVDLDRIDVLGYTGRRAPTLARFLEVASPVGTIMAEALRGETTTLRDALTADDLRPGPLPARQGPDTPQASSAAGPDEEAEHPLARFYLAIPVSDRGRQGPPSAIVEVPLTSLPDPPLDLNVSYTEEAVTVSWQPSGGLLGFLLDLAPAPPVSPLDEGPRPSQPGDLPIGPTRYNIYREATEVAGPLSNEPSPADQPPAHINQAPVATLRFVDPVQLGGQRRCYTVTAVRGTGQSAVEGRPSAPACVTPVDTFAPRAPTGVSPLATEGEIILVWEANGERDLRGYVVLRGEQGDDMLRPLSDEIIAETRFTDRDVTPGVRYVYAVTAVDTRLPEPNVSPESERVEVTAR